MRHRVGRLVAIFPVLRQRSMNHPVDRDNRGRSAKRRWLLGGDRVEDAHDGVTRERRVSAEHLEEQAARGEEIGASIDGLPQHLFGRHVGGRAHDRPFERETRRGGATACRNWPGQPEIEQLHTVGRQEDVRRFQITMHKAPAMQRLERGQNRQRDLDRFGAPQRTPQQPDSQRLPLKEFHDQEQLALLFA
ncbi:MAG TPA: hypothetical protein VFO31_02940, partial [Vicinamibacterales bacterium]|nr:hypothetical protein [Vicinamibacterales bacterium]